MMAFFVVVMIDDGGRECKVGKDVRCEVGKGLCCPSPEEQMLLEKIVKNTKQGQVVVLVTNI